MSAQADATLSQLLINKKRRDIFKHRKVVRKAIFSKKTKNLYFHLSFNADIKINA